MNSSFCNCDEMISKTEAGESYAPYNKSMALSWTCPSHGKVSVDFRDVKHTHPPQPPIAIRTTEPLPKKNSYPRFHPGGGGDR